MFNTESKHLLNLSVQNALDCISEDFNVKHFPGRACTRISPEKCALRNPDGRYRAHIVGRHLIPSTKLTSSSQKTFHFSYMKFLDEMFIKVKVSSIFKEKNNSG